VQTWLAAAEISSGPVFRAVALGGKVSDRPLADDSAARVVKRYAARVGLEVATFSGHSLRSGFLTSAAESGANVFKMAAVSRHRSLDTLRGYVPRVDVQGACRRGVPLRGNMHSIDTDHAQR
jgi:integrase